MQELAGLSGGYISFLAFYIPARPTAAVSPDDALAVNARVAIPRAELSVRVSRSGGPGGQHVNTSSTRVELSWDLGASRALTDDERARARTALASKLDGTGVLRVVASDTRSQTQNRVLAEERLAALVRRALVVPRVRRKTKPTRASVERRLETKRKSGSKKRDRRWRGDD